MPASIEDVAQKANVSISTVSRVLNRREMVNEKTRARVEEAIRELRYRPNAFARGLMLQRSNILGLVLPDIHGEFYSEIIRGANMMARELGFQLIVSSAMGGDDSRAVLSSVVQDGLLDGVALMVSELDGAAQASIADLVIPFVVLDCEVENSGHDTVLIDQRQGAMMLMRHLIDDGQAGRIVFVGGQATNIDTIKRHDAYRNALDEAGLPYTAADVHHLDYRYETAFELCTEHVDDWAQPGTCVFAANDEMAAGIVAASSARQIPVPDRLAVAGFDDTRIARMTHPPLTTVRVPMSEMGAEAVRLLCERLEDRDRAPQTVSLKSELVVRQSCGAARPAASMP
jgi:LacI family transcriptional regulator